MIKKSMLVWLLFVPLAILNGALREGVLEPWLGEKIANKPNRVVFQMRKYGINLPGYLELDFSDTSEGLLLTETLRIGLNGIGKICDLFIKIRFGKYFYNEFREHHKREWENLSYILQ